METTELTQLTDEQRAELVGYLNQSVVHLENLSDLIDKAIGILKCKELQMVAVDISSIIDHLTNLSDNGPTPPWAEIPLAQSEVKEY
jgi:hypothetical protein